MTAPMARSVPIPNFNYARYIGETIESVLLQASPGTDDDDIEPVHLRDYANAPKC